MPRLNSETLGAGDQSWLGSTHALHNAATAAPDSTLFSAAAFPNGVPSGTPVGLVTASNKVGPYAAAATDGRNVLYGFLATDQKAPGDGGWPVIWHGRIKVGRLPVAFTAPADTGQFAFTKEV